MKALYQRGLFFLAGVSCAAASCFISPAFAASPSQSAPSSGPVKRWVQFELGQTDPTEGSQRGKVVALTIYLGGVTPGTTPIVAICESPVFLAQPVTLELDTETMALKGTVQLEPTPMSRTSIPPKVARVQVTFARIRREKPEWFMRRAVYVTMGQEAPISEPGDVSSDIPEEPQPDDLVSDEMQPAATPISTGMLVEENLVPPPVPEEGAAYWQQVSRLISRSWAQLVRNVHHAASRETVKVHFKMYPNGQAQLIEIERGSGSRAVDEAGIFAVVNAQAFPSFPGELGDEVVDVHVRMRTGIRSRSREVQSIVHSSRSKSDAAGQPSKQ
ncbi:MAG: TonB C-terminal domain-containing protein [Nitrospira sp.]|nr:TonB C-terminal domain-containing protein [Nitrospira sp.]